MEITVATLIYKSTSYLDFVIDSLLKHESKKLKLKYLVVSNDATDEVVKHANYISFKNKNIRHVQHQNIFKDEIWINRVYNAWNRCLEECDTPYICFVNSDMAFTNGWLDNLAKHDLNKFIPTCRLVESGRMPSLNGLISKNFGQTLATFNKFEFEKYAEEIKENRVTTEVGAYMPCLISCDMLRSIGGWSKNLGNIPGDRITFGTLKRNLGIVNLMCHDSIAYHFQRGESAEVGDL